MSYLSAFIKYYVIVSAIFLTSTSDFNQEEISDFDENSQVTFDSDSLLEDASSNSFQTTATFDIDTEASNLALHSFSFSEKSDSDSEEIVNHTNLPDFWTTLHSIESKQGKLLYRPSNKNKSCASTASPCGHHQLSLQALKDISCTTKKCKVDREDYEKSLAMSKRLEAINLKRLKKAGLTNLPEYQQYLIHQQGAAGLKIILAASKGKKKLSKSLERNMANNSPYSYRKLNRMGSKLAAKKFLEHWNKKWQNEKKLIVAYRSKPLQGVKLASSYSKKNRNIRKNNKASHHLLFNDYQLQIALNLKVF